MFQKAKSNKGESVLVHCLKGMSRSATITIAIVMMEMVCDRESAIKWVQSRHPNAYPNKKFLKELGKLEKRLKIQEIVD